MIEPYPDTTTMDEDILRPLLSTGRRYVALFFFLSAVAGWGLFAWLYQIRNGMGASGLNQPVYWGLYITNFVFWIGISHSGTMISAILRLTKAEWRYSITRPAEMMTILPGSGFGGSSVRLKVRARALTVAFGNACTTASSVSASARVASTLCPASMMLFEIATICSAVFPEQRITSGCPHRMGSWG